MSERLCLDCGADLAGKRADAQFCDGTCKKRWQRKQPKSKSHVVQLKERTKERILGRREAPSTACQTKPPALADVPPVLVKRTFIPVVEHEFTDEERLEMYRTATYDDGPLRPEVVEFQKELAAKLAAKLADATAGLPPEALPEVGYTEEQASADGMPEHVIAIHKELIEVTKPLRVFTPLPIQHHGTENDLARSIISKVPATKLDPNSEEAELARLQKSQLRTTKKKD